MLTSLNLGPSINRLVTDGNIKIYCRGCILVLFQSITANKFDSEHNKLFPVCQVELLQATVNKTEVLSSF